ncbi:MAG TPA: N-acetylmuramoyl-L-alanine amidase [Nitrospirota bacterium]
MRTVVELIVLCSLLLPAAALPAEKGLTVNGVRFFSYPAFTRVVFEVEAAAPYVITKTPDGHGLLFRAYDGRLALKSALPPIRDGIVSGVELREEAGNAYLLVRLDPAAGEAKDFVLRGPDRIVLDISRGSAPAGAAPQADKPLVVVLDPGHGGKDGGITGARGEEKTLALELALQIRKNLRKDQRFTVVLTREKEQALSLDDRAAISNTAGASIFVSIHAAAGAGGRVYIEDLSDDGGGQTAQPPRGDFLGFEAGSEQQAMVWGRQQAAHARESGLLGRRLAQHLAGKEDAEAVQAPLAGLRAVDAAAALIEFGMEQDISRTAEAVAGGIEQYARDDR